MFPVGRIYSMFFNAVNIKIIIFASTYQFNRPDMEENKQQKNRRTRNQLKIDMLAAVAALAGKKPMSDITLVDVGNEAGIRMEVLKKNYGTVEKVLAIYAASVDYWIADLAEVRHPENHPCREEMSAMLTQLAATLYRDPDMQRLLIWEVCDDNATTRRLAVSREQLYRPTIESYNALFSSTGLHFDMLASVLTAGIYYLILRRHRSTFWGVDFGKRTEQKRFLTAIDQFVSLLFTALQEQDRVHEIARKLKAKGVSTEVIAECTGVSLEVVERM